MRWPLARLLRRDPAEVSSGIQVTPLATAEVTLPDGVVLVFAGLKRPVWTPAYAIDEAPVTNEQYLTFLLATGREPEYSYWRRHRNRYTPRYGEPSDPVTSVSHREASEFALWAGKRLPRWVEILRAALGAGATGWPPGGEADVQEWYDASWNHDWAMFIADKRVEAEATERMRAIESRFVPDLTAASAIKMIPLFEWCLESAMDTVEAQEERYRIPQMSRLHPYGLFSIGEPTDPIAASLKYGLYVPGLGPKGGRATEERLWFGPGTWEDRVKDDSEPEAPLFAPGAFLGTDPEARLQHRSMITSLQGGLHGGRIGFRCARDA